ncbi:class I adenylate-forming enzyme family protein [Natronosalvus vescus]|uniref:class I adenylate-forming enzyme family protein n=1 Tax=Natronosalvus vescus TaxID=2953881 RepID=UPI002090E0C1|nr:AMP-binding protein [Natronosalvus vescus]
MTGLEWATDDLLARRTAATPERLALTDVDTDRRWTYRELDAAVEALTTRLPGRPGDRIGVLLSTRPAFVHLLFAAMRADRTLVLLNVEETGSELASKAARSDVTALICEERTEELARESAGDHPVYVLEEVNRDAGSASSLTQLEGGGNDTHVLDHDPIDLAADESDLLIAFTSGTSGEPKAVRLTPTNLVSSATASAFRLGVSPDDRWLCCLPMYHMGGLAPVFRSALYGTTVVLQRSFDPKRTGKLLETAGVTGVSLVPTMLTRLLEAGWTPGEHLRFVLLGGAPAGEELLERCRRQGVPVYPTYGMTETASQIATTTPEAAFSHPGTVGQPLVYTDVSIIGDDGTPVGAGETGEIVVSGPTVTPGYLEPERTDAAFGEHGLHTGDIGRRDDDGRLWVLDRKSDRIVTGGENVDPGEVQAVLEEHPAVTDATVVGLPDPEWGERVGALVVDETGAAADDSSLEPHTLRSFCRKRLAGFKCPKTIALAASLPRTHSGTVDREAVEQRLLNEGVDVSSEL